MHIALWAVVLSLFWLLLSGYIQPLLLSFGVISVFLVLLVVKRMDDVDQELKKVNLGLSILRYTPWLMKEIFSSSIHVSKLIWGSPKDLSPTLAKISAKNIPAKKRVLYANSITLTPGTLSLDIVDDQIIVHALQAESIEELKAGAMENKIAGLWSKEESQNEESDQK
jgi:multicomponent Na+:H+ antiporter subunit E